MPGPMSCLLITQSDLINRTLISTAKMSFSPKVTFTDGRGCHLQAGDIQPNAHSDRQVCGNQAKADKVENPTGGAPGRQSLSHSTIHLLSVY
jgi:hypothetical protein